MKSIQKYSTFFLTKCVSRLCLTFLVTELLLSENAQGYFKKLGRRKERLAKAEGKKVPKGTRKR